jgi:hypothetical protein
MSWLQEITSREEIRNSLNGFRIVTIGRIGNSETPLTKDNVRYVILSSWGVIKQSYKAFYWLDKVSYQKSGKYSYRWNLYERVSN